MLIQTIGGRYQTLAAAVGFGTTFVAEDTYLPATPSVSSNNSSLRQPVRWHYRQRRLFDTEALLYHRGITIRFHDFSLLRGKSRILQEGSSLNSDQPHQWCFSFARHLVTLHRQSIRRSLVNPGNLPGVLKTASYLIDFGAVKHYYPSGSFSENKIYRCHWHPDMYLVNKPTATLS